MDPESPVQRVFAEALEVPPGEGQADFVERRCGKNVALLREVRSLLRAHEAAGDFLLVRSSHSTAVFAPGTSLVQGGQTQSAAICADAFLRACSGPAAEGVDDYVAGLPSGIQKEACERIHAGLRVRQLCGTKVSTVPEAVDELPRLPGFRIEGRVGQGGLGVVYAAHDEKLNRRVAIKVLRRSSDAEVRRRVLQEARHTAALGDPAVVTIYSVPVDARRLLESPGLRVGSLGTGAIYLSWGKTRLSASGYVIREIKRSVWRQVVDVSKMSECVVEDCGQFDILHMTHRRHGGAPSLAGETVEMDVDEIIASALGSEQS